jgi:class 3 adenylate cyclase/tetratricopeptide (TPR) repeat protein
MAEPGAEHVTAAAVGVWSELRRRRVTRVAFAYLVVAWAAIEAADTILPHLGLPPWSVTLVIVMVVLGFPISMVLAWAYDLTPEGVQRTRPAADWRTVQDVLARALDLADDERGAFIRDVCGSDVALRAEVESLLAAHERPGALDRPPLLDTPPPSDVKPALARRAPQYDLLDKIGGGGMGVVYRARDRRLERIVALKFLPPHMSSDESAKERFLVEAQAAAALDHPNICTIYEAGETDDGQLFLAMPYYDGETLKRRLQGGALPLDEALRIALQVARGLARAHELGIVHRDIKPANLMLTSEELVKIVDFGVAKLARADVTRPGVALGTVAYMSPEQAEGDDVDGRTDIWSLGVVLYEMLTGRRPFSAGSDRMLLHAIATAEPPRLADLRENIPPALEDIVLRALAKRRTERYANAREMSAALEALLPERATGGSGALSGAVATASTGGASVSAGRAGPDTSSGGLLAEGERRQATIVVGIVCGYDQLVERLVPEQMNRMLERIRQEAETVAAVHGGLLNQFTGDRVTLLFGVPAALEDDAIRATRAALDLHARLARAEVVEAGVIACLHTGIDTGTIVAHSVEGGDRVFRVTGAAQQVAARLAEQADDDEIWISTESRSVVAAWFELEAREPLKLRGRKHPLVPYRVLRESGLQTRMEAAERSGLTAFAGREAELETLQHALDMAVSGEGRLVTITGEAGLGKSRLLHELRQSPAGRDVPVLIGRCQSYGGGVAYLPFIDILRHGLGLGNGDDIEDTVRRLRAIDAALDEFIPLYLHLLSIRSTAYPVPRHLQGDAFRLVMHEALAAILMLHARNRPSVLVLEDWHWADDASQAVLRQLAEVLPTHPLLVLLTARPGYGVDSGSDGEVTQILLKPLAQAATAAMLRSMLGVDDVAPAAIELIHERTAGNPFFIEEICHALVEEGSLRVQGSAAVLTEVEQLIELPDSIHGVIRARLDRLDREARDVLRLGAVIGREFSRAILEKALPDATPLPAALGTLKAAGLIQQTRVAPDSAYRFKHVLTQEVAYASLLEHQRRELHGRVGAIMEDLHGERTDDELERLAHHFSRAEQWDRAIAWGLQSAGAANRLAQFSDALQVLERTQRWAARLPAGGDRDAALVDILLQQERLCETLGQRQRQQQLIDQLVNTLRDSSDRSRLAEVYLRQGDLFTLLRRYAEADVALQRSLALRRELADRVGERNTLRSIGLLRWHEGRNAEALEAAEQTLRIDRERDDLAAIAGDMTNCGAILRALGEHERAQAILEEALAIGDHLEDGDARAVDDELAVKHVYALHHLSNIHRERGDRARALECLQRAGAIAEEKRLPIQLAYHYTSVAHVYLQEGLIEESLQFYRDAIDLTRRARYALGLAQCLRMCGEVLLGLGRHEEALVNLQEAAATFADVRDAEGEARMWSAVATCEEKLGRHSAALTAWGRAAQLCRQLQDGVGELAAVEGLARATRAHLPEPSLALAHYERAVQLALALGDSAAEGRMRNVMGILEWGRGAYEVALWHYERAFGLFQQLGDSASAGLMLNSIAATLRALGRDSEAEPRLHEALALHRDSGQRQLEAHALALIAATALDREDAEAATRYFGESLQLRRALGDRRGEGWMLHGLARCELVRSVPFKVREHAAGAARIAEECGDSELAQACEQLRRVAD